jgi:hypothetical protein
VPSRDTRIISQNNAKVTDLHDTLLHVFVLICITEVQYMYYFTVLSFQSEDLYYTHYNIFLHVVKTEYLPMSSSLQEELTCNPMGKAGTANSVETHVL